MCFIRRTLLFPLRLLHLACGVRDRTFRYRTISGLQNPSRTLRYFVFYYWMCLLHPHLFIVHEYWRNFTSYVQIYHPPNDSLHRFVATANHLSMDYPLRALPLRDREVISLCNKLPCIFCILLHGLCRAYGFAVHIQTGFILLLASQKRLALDFQTSSASHTTGAKVFHTFFYYYDYWGTSILLNMLILSNCFVSIYFHMSTRS